MLMKVCIFGVGAIGGNVGARLAAARGGELSVIARGAQLKAIRERGLVLRTDDSEVRGRPAVATDDPVTLPQQDLVVVTLKANALPDAAAAIARLIAPGGCALFLNNGIPWWWPHGLEGGGGTLPLIDPDGSLWKHVRPERALGCVIYGPSDVIEPGVVLHSGGSRWVMGEPDGSMSARLDGAIRLFRSAGLKAEAASDIRREVWLKLVRNAPANSLAALTRLGLPELTADPALRPIAARIVRETLAVAAALGWDLHSEVDPEQIAGRSVKGGPRLSMLQDVLHGRPIEAEVHLGQTQAFARDRGVPVPTIDALLPLLRGLDRALRSARAAR
jgi:2-dehydropantoate 2-reductase